MFAAEFVATSANITARMILGAAVTDDIGAILLFGGVTALQSGSGGVFIPGLVFVPVQAVGFVALVRTGFLRHRNEVLDAPINPLSPLPKRQFQAPRRTRALSAPTRNCSAAQRRGTDNPLRLSDT